jgi:hypothetical protein
MQEDRERRPSCDGKEDKGDKGGEIELGGDEMRSRPCGWSLLDDTRHVGGIGRMCARKESFKIGGRERKGSKQNVLESGAVDRQIRAEGMLKVKGLVVK